MPDKVSQRGFSLIELMVVLLIAMLLMAIAIPNFMTTYRANRLNSAMIDMANLVQRTRYEAVRTNSSLACRVILGTPLTFFIDLDGDTALDANEPTVILPPEFQFGVPGTPGPASMGYTATNTPPLRITFDGRGALDFTGTAPGMGIAPAVLIATLGNINNPQDGFRALAITPSGKATVWRASFGGSWSH